MDYLSDGISESLINSLSQMPGLKVIARSSSFKYKGKEISPEEVAKALGVQTILSGRITQRGESLQVSAELMNVHDKTQMWGEQFNRQVKDVLYIQNESLRLRLTKSERQHFEDAAKANPQAYELLLKARFHRLKRTPHDLNKAAEYYQQALAIDPNYALAHVSLAGVYSYMASNGFHNPKEMTPKAEAALQRALELDETLPQIHATLAEINKNSFNWAGAERAFKRTIELDPNMASAHSGFAYYLSTQQRHEEALAEIKKARELDPLAISYRANIGHILYFAQQFDQAIEQLKQTIELDRNYEYSHVVLGYAYAANGQYAEALTEYKETSGLGGDTTSLQCYVGYALAKMGQREEAKAILSRLETSDVYVSPAELALLYGGLGEKEKALSALDRAYAEHDLQLQFLTIDPHYNDLAAEPRFTALLQKVGLSKE